MQDPLLVFVEPNRETRELISDFILITETPAPSKQNGVVMT